MILVVLGGALGVLVAFIGIRLFVALAPTFYPPSEEIGINGPVLLFTLAVCIVTGILSGVAPGLSATKFDLHAALKQAGRGTDRGLRLGRRILVVAEIGLAMVLLVGAGLMVNSYARATSVQMGLNPDRVLRSQIILTGMDRRAVRRNHRGDAGGCQFYRRRSIDRGSTRRRISRSHQRAAAAAGSRFVSGWGGGSPRGRRGPISRSFSTRKLPVLRGARFQKKTGTRHRVCHQRVVRAPILAGVGPIGQSIAADLTAANQALKRTACARWLACGGVRMNRAEFTPIICVLSAHLTDYSEIQSWPSDQELCGACDRQSDGRRANPRRVFENYILASRSA
jgi:hypothetical protein